MMKLWNSNSTSLLWALYVQDQISPIRSGFLQDSRASQTEVIGQQPNLTNHHTLPSQSPSECLGYSDADWVEDVQEATICSIMEDQCHGRVESSCLIYGKGGIHIPLQCKVQAHY